MKSTDNLITRYFLKSLNEAVAEEDPVAGVESGAPEVDGLASPAVDGEDPSVTGAESAVSELANSGAIDQVQRKAAEIIGELKSINEPLRQAAQLISGIEGKTRSVAASNIVADVKKALDKALANARSEADKLSKWKSEGAEMTQMKGDLETSSISAPQPESVPPNGESGNPPAPPA